MSDWWVTDGQLMSGWWAADERLMSDWWVTDEQLMSNWWATDEQLMSDWWATDERLMSNWWATDEQLMSDWWATDERWLLMLYIADFRLWCHMYGQTDRLTKLVVKLLLRLKTNIVEHHTSTYCFLILHLPSREVCTRLCRLDIKNIPRGETWIQLLRHPWWPG